MMLDVTERLIEPGFMFSQHSLNTYARCRRRSLLKYVDRQPWPVPDRADPDAYREHLERGRVLHEWLARESLGVDVSQLVANCEDGLLRAWWDVASKADLMLPEGVQEPELPLVVGLGDYRLYARFDLVALDPGGDAVVVDWKTLASRPRPAFLRSRLQTRVYLYALVAAGHTISGGVTIVPERVQMIYWFTNFPDDPEMIAYSRRQWEDDRRFLLGMVDEIATLPREGYVKCEDRRECAYCSYRTLCHGQAADELTASEATWLDEDLDDLLDMDEIEPEAF